MTIEWIDKLFCSNLSFENALVVKERKIKEISISRRKFCFDLQHWKQQKSFFKGLFL